MDNSEMSDFLWQITKAPSHIQMQKQGLVDFLAY